MFVVDTNVLIYAALPESSCYEICRRRIAEWRGQSMAWYLTWGIVYEFLRVSTHPRIFRKPFQAWQAWAYIESLLASPSLGLLIPTERHAPVAAEVIAQTLHLSGNILLDAQTAVLMKEHGIRRIYTRDTDFHRFPFIEPVDPTG